MRRLILQGLVAIVVFGCATTTQQSNAQKMRSLYEAFGRGDVPTVLAAFDPNIEWNEAENFSYASGSPYRGPQAITQGIFMRLVQEWNGFRVTPLQFIDGGDTVAVLGRYTGTFKSTSQPLDAQFVHVWTFRDGKIVRFQQFTDTAQFGRVMGASR